MKQWLSKLTLPGIIGLLIAALYLAPPIVNAQEEPITHKVSVNVMLLPVFVTGPDGEPVHGLNQDDFELYANGRKATISHFLRFDFQHDEKTTETVTVKGKPIKIKTPSRAIFIIIDSVFCDFFGFRRAKKIAVDVVKQASPEDMFVVIENHVAGGPRLLAGPEDSRETIIRKINKLKLPSSKWSKDLHLTREYNVLADNSEFSPIQFAAEHQTLSNRTKYAEKMAYKNLALSFAGFLRRLKFALKTIDRPKVVFLISEGIARDAFKNLGPAPEPIAKYTKFHSPFIVNEKNVAEVKEDRDMRMFRNLYKVINAINEGGSVLYTINPGRIKRDYEASGEMSLRFMANESGGQYIAGKDTTKIIEKVKTVTSAYYEIAFIPTPDMGNTLDIKLKCKRPGVKVDTFRKAEQKKPYYRMEPLEKKLFALNMVTGGTWSRLMGKVVRVKYQKNGDQIQVIIPPKMRNKKLDIFSIQLNPKSQKADIQFQTLPVADSAQLPIINKKNSTQFFVIIEPVFAYCIYNRI